MKTFLFNVTVIEPHNITTYNTNSITSNSDNTLVIFHDEENVIHACDPIRVRIKTNVTEAQIDDVSNDITTYVKGYEKRLEDKQIKSHK